MEESIETVEKLKRSQGFRYLIGATDKARHPITMRIHVDEESWQGRREGLKGSESTTILPGGLLFWVAFHERGRLLHEKPAM